MGLKLASPWAQVVSVLHFIQVRPLPHSGKNIFYFKHKSKYKTTFSFLNDYTHAYIQQPSTSAVPVPVNRLSADQSQSQQSRQFVDAARRDFRYTCMNLFHLN